MRRANGGGNANERRPAARRVVAAATAIVGAGWLVGLATGAATASPRLGSPPARSPQAEAGTPRAEAGAADIVGAWEAQSYLLSSGEEHNLAGKIFFTASHWQVVFFVLDDEGAARRGSAEGGAYATEGERLTFMHRFNLSVGEALPGLPADDLRMVVHDTMTSEAARFAIDDDTLTLFFPSGNAMRFRRTS